MTEELEQQETRRLIARERMQQARVTNLEVAALVGIAPENLSRMLTGTLNLTQNRFRTILEAVALLHRQHCCTNETNTEDE